MRQILSGSMSTSECHREVATTVGTQTVSVPQAAILQSLGRWVPCTWADARSGGHSGGLEVGGERRGGHGGQDAEQMEAAGLEDGCSQAVSCGWTGVGVSVRGGQEGCRRVGGPASPDPGLAVGPAAGLGCPRIPGSLGRGMGGEGLVHCRGWEGWRAALWVRRGEAEVGGGRGGCASEPRCSPLVLDLRPGGQRMEGAAMGGGKAAGLQRES